MSKITIDFINQNLPEKWKCISDTYKNLTTELTFQCDEGHVFQSVWKKMRVKSECPICKNNKLKEKVLKIEPKGKNTKRILALDQATYISGWAIFDNDNLIRYGTYTTNLSDEISRDNSIKNWLITMIDNWQPDIIGIEGIQFQDESSGYKVPVTTFQMLARLQGILMEVCYENKIECIVCPTNTWRHHCKVTGKYRTDKKRSMQNIVKKLYDISVSNDEADAIGIGKYLADLVNIKTENWE